MRYLTRSLVILLLGIGLVFVFRSVQLDTDLKHALAEFIQSETERSSNDYTVTVLKTKPYNHSIHDVMNREYGVFKTEGFSPITIRDTLCEFGDMPTCKDLLSGWGAFYDETDPDSFLAYHYDHSLKLSGCQPSFKKIVRVNFARNEDVKNK